MILFIHSRLKLRKNLPVERPNIQLKLGESSLHPPCLTNADPIPSVWCILNPYMIKNSWWSTLTLILSSSTGTDMSFWVVKGWNEAQLCNILFMWRTVTGRSKRSFHVVIILQSAQFLPQVMQHLLFGWCKLTLLAQLCHHASREIC